MTPTLRNKRRLIELIHELEFLVRESAIGMVQETEELRDNFAKNNLIRYSDRLRRLEAISRRYGIYQSVK